MEMISGVKQDININFKILLSSLLLLYIFCVKYFTCIFMRPRQTTLKLLHLTFLKQMTMLTKTIVVFLFGSFRWIR